MIVKNLWIYEKKLFILEILSTISDIKKVVWREEMESNFSRIHFS